MGLKLVSEHLNGLKLFEPEVFSDERGFFLESYRRNELRDFGIKEKFVQDNHSGSVKNTLRGMHFQWEKPQGKLIRVTTGEALVVEVDIRVNSPTLGKHESIILSAENKRILWVPPGFANGFLVLSDWCEMQYKCTEYYNSRGESGILWNDIALGIEWNVTDPIVSEKDRIARTLHEWLKTEESENFNF